MVAKKEIEKIIEWCDRKKRETGKIVLVERNPFRDEISWTYRFPLIEIDRGLEVASKTSLVYDSSIKELWQYLNGEWRRVQPSIEISFE
ncbi:MAG: hypothetical protein WC501_04900 [Candidatus Micrarchaeia archaeon]